MATETRIINDDVRDHVGAGINDGLSRLGGGQVDCDGAHFNAIFGCYFLGLGIELFFTATNKDEVTMAGCVDVDEAGAQSTVGAGNECHILHDKFYLLVGGNIIGSPLL